VSGAYALKHPKRLILLAKHLYPIGRGSPIKDHASSIAPSYSFNSSRLPWITSVYPQIP